MSLIFIAIPTKGTVSDGKLNTSFLADFAALYTRFPDLTFLSPMVQDYQMLPHMCVLPLWDHWAVHCKRIIERSDEVWVLKYPGYDTSVGVAGEVAHANAVGVPVKYVDVTTWEFQK